MKTKHTKGEWYVSTSRKEFDGITAIYAEDRMLIAEINVARRRDEENEANAKLMAAAPEMLEALIFARSVMISNGIFEASERLALEKIDKAIKNASE